MPSFNTTVKNLPIFVDYTPDRYGEINMEIIYLYRVQLGFGGALQHGEELPADWATEHFTDEDWDRIEREAKSDYQQNLIDQYGG